MSYGKLLVVTPKKIFVPPALMNEILHLLVLFCVDRLPKVAEFDIVDGRNRPPPPAATTVIYICPHCILLAVDFFLVTFFIS